MEQGKLLRLRQGQHWCNRRELLDVADGFDEFWVTRMNRYSPLSGKSNDQRPRSPTFLPMFSRQSNWTTWRSAGECVCMTARMSALPQAQ
jgi:hypothetical protein